MSGTNEAINVSNETLLRYLHEESKFRSDGSVKFGAFLPVFDENYQRLETSIFRRACFSDLWEAGTLHCEGLRPVKAVAVFKGRDVLDSELDVDPDDDPPGHASIVGWPKGTDYPEDEDDKDERKQRAIRLAKHARSERRETPS